MIIILFIVIIIIIIITIITIIVTIISIINVIIITKFYVIKINIESKISLWRRLRYHCN